MRCAVIPSTAQTRQEPSLEPSLEPSRKVRFWVGMILFALTVLTFAGSIAHEFINFDDPDVILNQSMVRGGLSVAGLKWALGHVSVAHWDPLTTISHQASCAIFGLNSGGHHLINVLLHGLTALLLFHALRSLTGAFWRSALVAALFALHPLRVESVAWVTERKDVLSGVFFMLTLWSYFHYNRQRTVPRYLLLTLFFSMGLLSKSMLVTAPFVLLLLDYWPLGNFQGAPGDSVRNGLRRVGEKLPLLALSGVSSAIQVHSVHAVVQHIPWLLRLQNSVVCYVEYLRMTLWPSGLAAFYPLPDSITWGPVLMRGTVLAVVTAVSVLLRRRQPYLAMGWFWFLGMLVPVIGVIQVGTQSMADRYTYLPSIGFFIMLVWGADACRRCWRLRPALCGAAAALLVLVCAGLSMWQLQYWSDSETLFRRAVVVTERNYFARYLVAVSVGEVPGRVPEAVAELEKVTQMAPGFVDGHLRLGMNLAKWPGHSAEALVSINRAIQLGPQSANAHFQAGCVLANNPGNREAAIAAFQRATELNPNYAEAFHCLGNALVEIPERSAEAIEAYQRAIKIKPDYAEAHGSLGALYLRTPGRLPEATAELHCALSLNPLLAASQYNLGLAYSMTVGGESKAIRFYETALKLRPDMEIARKALAELLAQKQAPEQPK